MRWLPCLFLLVCCACANGGVQDASARVRVPAAVAFPRTWVGEQSQAAVLVEATASGPVRVARVVVDDPAISIERGDPRVLAGGTSLTLTLAWRPSGAGSLASALHVFTDVEGAEELVVPLSGVAEVPPDCDDGNACTDDTFDRATGTCRHANHDRACDDGNACTSGDRCLDGLCLGRAVTCDDGDACTRNLCDAAIGCVFPPDGRRCDDGDPCTRDVCDRDAGCVHADADEGTPCGAFACSEAHVCVGGTCRVLDVTGLSDGFPCFDGDLCTEDDQCLAGACLGGPRAIADPTVLASIETFGGEGDFLASDGVRFVFATGRDVRIAVRNAEGALEIRGRLPNLPSAAPPAVAGTGQFVLANHDNYTLVDATDAAHPRIVWGQALPRRLGAARDIRRLWKVDGGLLFLTSVPGVADEILYVPILGPPQLVGAPRVLFRDAAIRDADCDGTHVVVAGRDAARWWRLGGGGEPLEVAALNLLDTTDQVAVSGNEVAVSSQRWDASGSEVLLLAIQPAPHVPRACQVSSPTCRHLAPGCDPLFTADPGEYNTCSNAADCPSGTFCRSVGVTEEDGRACGDGCCSAPVGLCFEASPTDFVVEGAQPPGPWIADLAFTDAGLVASMHDGLHLLRPLANLTVRDELFDPYSAAALARAPGLLLTMGDVALPLALTEAESDPPRFERVTGPGHGRIVAAADGEGPTVVLAGPMAAGSVDIVNGTITSWSMLPIAGSAYRPRILEGATTSAVIDLSAFADGRERLPDDACRGTPVTSIDRRQQLRELPICGIDGASLETAGRTLFAATILGAGPGEGEPPRGLRAWDLDRPGDPPVALGEDAAMSDVGDLRAAPDGTLLALSHPDPAHLRARQVSGTTGAVVADARFPFADVARASRWNVAADGPAWIFANGQLLAFYAANAGSLHEVAHLTESASVDATVRSMSHGRAFVAYRRYDDETGWLTQVNYEADGTAFTQVGSIPLEEPVSRVFDAGAAAVVTSAHAIKIVRPACR